MKTASTSATQARKSLKPRRRLTSRQRGVAIITVLAVIVLMSVLVLSFFQMSKSEQVSAKVNADILRSYSLRDTAINLAIAQIREATAPTTSSANANALWTSQPGMIRTFDKAGNNGPLFKLYSAKQMVVDGSISEEALLKDDLSPTWNQSGSSTKTNVENPVWVDINKPIFKTNTSVGSGSSTTSLDNLGTPLYPIVDPAAYDEARNNATDDPTNTADKNPEGFSYKDTNGRLGGTVVSGKSLPMPVRWLYILQDGTVGSLGENKEFIAPATGGNGGTPSADNPIVGRIAFWADDESCKININTASEGVFWDTPRCDTPEERLYANCPPSANEFQRYPGHPASVCLSSVLFPNKRYYAKGETGNGDYECELGALKVNGKMGRMKPSELRFIWDLAPFISDRSIKAAAASSAASPAGTVGGLTLGDSAGKIRRANLSDKDQKIDSSSLNNPDDHLYTSADELPFRGKKKTAGADVRYTWTDAAAATSKTPSPYTVPISEKQFNTRLARADFLLTARSSAPEVNVFGHPRLCLWPLNMEVPAVAASAGGGATGGKYTVFDTVIGLTCQLSPTNYYHIVRNDPGSRHNEFYGLAPEANGKGHNQNMWEYLKTATGTQVGKFPGVAGKNTFLSKYKSTAGNTIYSDRDNLFLNMLDYIRNTNLNDPLLKPDRRYGDRGANTLYPGQITGYCGCGGGGIHTTTWATAAQPDAKASGRTFAPTKLHWVLQKAGQVVGGAWVSGIANTYGIDYQGAAKNSGGTFVEGATVYEMGIVVEGACPSQGFSGMIPNATLSLGGGEPAGAQTDPNNPIPALYINSNAAETPTSLRLTNRKLTVASYASSDSTLTWPKNVPNWGGSQGIRGYGNPTPGSNTSLIRFKPFAIAGGATQFNFVQDPAKQNDFTNWDKYLWRVMSYDEKNVSGDVNQLVQCYYFHFGRPYTDIHFALPGGSASKTLNDQVSVMYNTVFDPSKFTGNATIQTLFIPHADYRTLNSRRIVGYQKGYDNFSLNQGSSGTGYTGKWNSFIPTKNFGTAQSDYCAYDPTQGFFASLPPANANIAGSLRTHPAVPITPAAGAFLLPATAVFDYPLEYEAWVEHTDPNQRKYRGSMDPAITGDWDNGPAGGPDGSYAGRSDEGDLRAFFSATGTPTSTANFIPYFGEFSKPGGDLGLPTPSLPNETAGIAAATPNRLIKGPVQYGSLSSGASTNTYWQSLLFRPDPFGGDPNATAPGDATWDNRHYGGSMDPNMPKDHLLLDLFWMPVVEPYALSDTFSTKGKINMNYKIMPFDYIHRATALHALMKSEKVLAIPSSAASVYKSKDQEYSGPVDKLTGKAEPKATWRRYIDAEATLWQFDRKFSGTGEFTPSSGAAPRVFRTASEICELWLVPENINAGAAKLLNATDNPYPVMRSFWLGIDKSVSNATARTLGGTSADTKLKAIKEIKDGHRLTGDNTKEAPYANLYPRLTTRSNVYKVHFTVQTLQKARSTPVNKFDPDIDQVTSEYRGSAIVERALDMTNPNLQSIRYLTDTSVFTDLNKRLDYFYSYRITEIKQFAP